jgi:hypothetical protein
MSVLYTGNAVVVTNFNDVVWYAYYNPNPGALNSL